MSVSHRYCAIVDSKENGIIKLIIEGDKQPLNLEAKYLPTANEGDVVEILFRVVKEGRGREKKEVSELIRDLQDK